MSIRLAIFAAVFGLLIRVVSGSVPQSLGDGAIEGRVESTDGAPLAQVHITIEGTTYAAISDWEGQFRIPQIEAGLYLIRASAIGFHDATKTIRVGSGFVVTVLLTLSPRIYTSDELVITASRREESALNVSQSLSVLSARELDVRNTVQLDDALRSIPGVQIQDNQVSIRGSSGFAYNTGSRALLLLDGMPLLTPDTDGVPFDILPFSQIERIEVMKGAGSALYGSGSLGGTINVITSDFPDEPQTKIRLHGSAYEPVRYREWREKWSGADRVRFKHGISISHARRTSQKFGYWFDVSFRNDEGYLNYGQERVFYGYGKLGWRPIPTLSLNVLAGFMDRKKDNFLFWNGANDVLNPGSLAIDRPQSPGPGVTPTGTNDVVNDQITLLPTLTHVLGERVFYRIRGRVYGMAIRPINNLTGNPESIDKGTLGLRAGGEAEFHYDATASRNLTAGASIDALATESDFFLTSTGDPIGSQPEVAVFAQLEESSVNRLKITAGLRYDTYRIDRSRSESSMSPRLSAAWSAGRNATIRAAYGHGFRVPSLAERYTDNRDFIPLVRNLGLKPEQSQTIELGGRMIFDVTVDSRVTSDLALFGSDYSNLIEPRLIPELQAFQFINLTRARVYGLEASVDWSISHAGISFRSGYTFLKTEDRNTGLPLPFRSAHLFIAGFDAHIAGPMSIGGDFRYASKPEQIDPDFALFVPDADQLIDTKLVDLRLSAEIDHFLARVLLKNAFDYYYIERAALFGAPRRLEIQLGWTF